MFDTSGTCTRAATPRSKAAAPATPRSSARSCAGRPAWARPPRGWGWPVVEAPSFDMPYAARLSPHVDRVRQHTKTWVRDMGMLAGAPWTEAYYDAADFGGFASLTHPTASLDDLKHINDWHTWGFYVHDAFLESFLRSRNVGGRPGVRRQAEGVAGGSVGTDEPGGERSRRPGRAVLHWTTTTGGTSASSSTRCCGSCTTPRRAGCPTRRPRRDAPQEQRRGAVREARAGLGGRRAARGPVAQLHDDARWSTRSAMSRRCARTSSGSTSSTRPAAAPTSAGARGAAVLRLRAAAGRRGRRRPGRGPAAADRRRVSGCSVDRGRSTPSTRRRRAGLSRYVEALKSSARR